MGYVLVAALVFGLCFCVDKGFSKIFRGTQQHKSGLSVRYNKKFAAFGLIFIILGISALFAGKGDLVLSIGGGFVILLGIGMITYYMTFGIFYDEDEFLLTTFGKKSAVYPYSSIEKQQLFSSGGTIVVELYLNDGKSVSVQSTMDGAYPFLDKAFAGWCRQKGINPEDCPFHDTSKSLWFPQTEEQ